MKKILSALVLSSGIALVALSGAITPALACDNSSNSTECGPETKNRYHGAGGKKPTLLPKICLPQKYYNIMTGPGVDFWYDYELVYKNGTEEKGDGVIRTRCSKKQWVSHGMKIKFWVDCNGYRYHFITAALVSNGQYDFKLVKKVKI